MNMQTGEQTQSEDLQKDKRYGHCIFEIDPFAVDLTGSMKIGVYRRATPADVPDTVMTCDDDWYVKVEWDLAGRLMHHLCGYFCVCVYLERIGPGPDLKLDCDGDGSPCLTKIPIVPCGDGHYEVKCDRPKEGIECEPCGTLYSVAVTLVSLDMCEDPGHIRAYCKGPTLFFYPTPEPLPGP